jgi:lipopolysaccharide heptosyltransferase II
MMQINAMKTIDFWIGIPACFVLSIVNFVSQLFDSNSQSTPRKILIVKPSEMGAIILAYPLLKKIKEIYPHSELFFLVFEKNKTVLDLLEGVVPKENILTLRDDSYMSFFVDTFKAVVRLQKEKIDVAMDLEFFSRFTACLSYFSGAHKRIGFYNYHLEGLYRGNLLTHRVQYNPLLHVSRAYLSFAQSMIQPNQLYPALDVLYDDIQLPQIFVKENKRIIAKLNALGLKNWRRLILINPGEGVLPLREWPLEYFVTLGRRILKEKEDAIVIVGSKGSLRRDEHLYSSLNQTRLLNLTGQTTLNELFELFSVADALVTSDCGLAHLASLSSIKQFVIFGPEHPAVFAPLGKNSHTIYAGLPCSPCLSAFNHRRSTCQHNQCLKVITPDAVYDLLNETTSSKVDERVFA